MVLMIHRMVLADAQSLAIRKLLSKSAYDSNIAPGPPLPKSHPSPALIAKLHLECANLYSSARALAKTPGASKGGSSEEVAGELRRYLNDEAAFHSALARKWLGVDAGENGAAERGGDAVGLMLWAKKELEELKDGGKGIPRVGKGEKGKKDKVAEELEAVGVFLKHYKKVNDSVSILSCFQISKFIVPRCISSLFPLRKTSSHGYRLAGWPWLQRSSPRLTQPSDLGRLNTSDGRQKISISPTIR